MNNKQAILAITGSDGTGGSGVQADIRCISELGGVVTSVITSITVQNTLGIQEFYDLPAAIVRKQIEAIFNDLQPQIVKIGLIRRIDVVATIAEMMQKYHPPKGYTEDSSRSGELYNLFLDAVDRFHHLYSDVAFYAEQLGVSARYLGQVTRHVANRSPKSIIDERITEDISAMLDTNKPLKEIARLLGFSSQAHLSRYYKKQTGKAPSEVRKR